MSGKESLLSHMGRAGLRNNGWLLRCPLRRALQVTTEESGIQAQGQSGIAELRHQGCSPPILPSHSTQQPLHINVEYLNHITLKVTKIAACVGHPHDPQTLRGWTTVLGFGEMTLWGQTTERTRYVLLLLFPPPPNMVVASAFCSWGNKHREGRGRDTTSLHALEFTGAGKVPFWLQTWTRWRPMVLQEQWGWFGGKSSDMSAGLRGCLLHLLSALWAPRSRRGPLPN